MRVCPNVLSSGSCPNPDCKLDHTVLLCELCGYIAPTPSLYKIHLTSKRHKSNISGNNRTYLCSICDRNISSDSWTAHLGGLKHRSKARKQGVSSIVEPEKAISQGEVIYCPICSFVVKSFAWDQHASSLGHRKRERFQQFRSVMDEAEKDKNGITVEGKADLSFVDPSNAARGVETLLLLKSSEPLGKSVLVEAKLASQHGGRLFKSGFVIAPGQVSYNQPITSSHPLVFKYDFRQQFIGRYEDRLELVFEDTQLARRFVIVRILSAIVGNQVEHEALKPVAPYVPRQKTTRTPETTVVAGVAPPSVNSIPYVVSLPHANIPKSLLALLSDSQSTTMQLAIMRRVFLPSNLDIKSYAHHYKHLLWAEEHRSEADLERYDMTNAPLSKHNKYYYLAIPGLAEKRPSVLVGDRMLVQTQNSRSGHWYEGHVHVLRQNEVGLVFHSSFNGWSEAARYNIRFRLNRLILRRQHQALDSAFQEARVLFPADEHIYDIEYKLSLTFYNPLISTNKPQSDAVHSIAYQPPGSVPFIVFGPPGTGKTITIVEAIFQVLRTNPLSKVLACAPSNSAADIIAERMAAAGLSPDHLFRMYAPSRSRDQVPAKLKNYAYQSHDEHFTTPPMDKLKTFRVVVSTCVSSSMLSGVGVPRGHYTHIFADEAGQATEPEVFIPIMTLADSRTNIILSGDPKQLGPIVRSGIARKLGLETSYLERLMKLDIYDTEEEHGTTVVKLTKNFRSHGAILMFPNERFYSGALEECASPSVINSYLSSPILPEPAFPVVFHAVFGKDDREASSPSYFNIDEAIQIRSYVQQLKASQTKRANDLDIGIIAPYHAQCLKLRTALKVVAPGVKVGSVEEFQGQERRVIIISTVRSSKDLVDYDLKHTLGFVANPRRFNVAVTRAQALLIVVGNPNVLALDPLWRSFLNYVYLSGGWKGPEIPWDPEAPVDQADYGPSFRKAGEVDMNDFTRRMEEMTLDQVGEVDVDVDANVDRPWREAE